MSQALQIDFPFSGSSAVQDPEDGIIQLVLKIHYMYYCILYLQTKLTSIGTMSTVYTSTTAFNAQEFTRTYPGISFRQRRIRNIKPRSPDNCKSTHQVPRTSQAAIFQAGKHAGAPYSGSLSIAASHALIASHVRSLPPTQTPETTLKREAVEAWAAQMIDSSASTATIKTRNLAVATFNQVACEMLGLSTTKYDWVQPTTPLLMAFVAHLMHDKRLKAQTVRIYISALRQFTLMLNQPDFYMDGHIPLFINTIINGAERMQALEPGRKKLVRIPVTTEMTLQIIEQAKVTLAPFNAARFIMILKCAYLGVLRIGDMLPQTIHQFEPGLHLCLPDVTISSVKLKGRQATTVDFNIKAKKNDKRRLGSTKSIIDQTGPMSINNAHEEWMMQHNTLASPLLSSAYFVEQNGNPTTTRTFRNELAVVNSVIHGLPKGILPHSFRKGAASTLDAHGFSDAAIAAAGDWKSSCFRKYITPAPERLNEIFSALATSSL